MHALIQYSLTRILWHNIPEDIPIMLHYITDIGINDLRFKQDAKCLFIFSLGTAIHLIGLGILWSDGVSETVHDASLMSRTCHFLLLEPRWSSVCRANQLACAAAPINSNFLRPCARSNRGHCLDHFTRLGYEMSALLGIFCLDSSWPFLAMIFNSLNNFRASSDQMQISRPLIWFIVRNIF